MVVGESIVKLVAGWVLDSSVTQNLLHRVEVARITTLADFETSVVPAATGGLLAAEKKRGRRVMQRVR